MVFPYFLWNELSCEILIFKSLTLSVHHFIKFLFSFLLFTLYVELSLLSVCSISSFLQKPNTNHGWASMTLSLISLSPSLLNHQLSLLKITLFSLWSHRSKWSRASMLLHSEPQPTPPQRWPLISHLTFLFKTRDQQTSSPYLISIPLKPQTHSSIYKLEGPRRCVDFGVDWCWSLSLLSLVVFVAGPWCG